MSSTHPGLRRHFNKQLRREQAILNKSAFPKTKLLLGKRPSFRSARNTNGQYPIQRLTDRTQKCNKSAVIQA